MQWFEQIEGIDILETEQDFFDFFQVPYQMQKLQVRHLHIMQDFHRQLVQYPTVAAEKAFATASVCLQQAYQRQTAQPLAEQSPLAVYQRLRPSVVPIANLFMEDDDV